MHTQTKYFLIVLSIFSFAPDAISDQLKKSKVGQSTGQFHDFLGNNSDDSSEQSRKNEIKRNQIKTRDSKIIDESTGIKVTFTADYWGMLPNKVERPKELERFMFVQAGKVYWEKNGKKEINVYEPYCIMERPIKTVHEHHAMNGNVTPGYDEAPQLKRLLRHKFHNTEVSFGKVKFLNREHGITYSVDPDLGIDRSVDTPTLESITCYKGHIDEERDFTMGEINKIFGRLIKIERF